jgi:two-component system NarL family response regulator
VPIRIVLAEDQRLVRQTFQQVLDSDPDIEVVGSGADGEEALLLCVEQRPDVALLDISMPKMDGLTAAEFIRERAPGTKVVMLTMHEEGHRVQKALVAGVDAYVLKDTSPGELIRIVKAIFRGEPVDSPHLVDRQFRREQETVRRLLSERELRLVDLVCCGESNATIAEELFVSDQTIKRDLAHVFEVLRVGNRTEMAVRALKLGLTGLTAAGEEPRG